MQMRGEVKSSGWGLMGRYSWKNFLALKKEHSGASLMAQWLRIRLPMKGSLVRALVWEDPTCRGATELVCHNY